MDLSGKSLGKYKIIRKLGGGGMGNVFLAHDTILDRMVAIKLLAPALAADANFVERFQLEARALARLDHPAIVRVFNADWVDNQLYLAMEYVEGGSLEDILAEQGPQTIPWSLKALRETAEGIDYAHDAGLVHRDIKPANILIDHVGQAQITDFGLVKDSEISLTADGQRLGTPAYMAPEQIQGREMGPAVDIYALGIVAFELFAGRPPFQGTISAVFEGHLLRTPPPIRQYNPAIPDNVQAVVGRALAKSPQDRFPTAEDFVDALEAAFNDAERRSDTLLDVDAAQNLPPEQAATILDPAPAGSDQRTAAPAAAPPTPAALTDQAPTHTTPAPGQSSLPPQEEPGRMSFFSGLGFGAVGIGTVITVIVLCLCGAGFLYVYGDQIFGLEPPETTQTLFQTGFDTPAQAGFPAENLPEGGLFYEQGGYLIRVNAPEWIFWGTVDREFADTTIEVDASNRSSVIAVDYGIICRYISDNDFYFGFISADGLYGIGRLFNGEFEVLGEAPTSPNAAIRTGNSDNRIRMDCEGSVIRLWANNTLLTQINGVETLSGDVGVLAGAPLQGGIAVLFDNFQVREVQRP